MTQHMAEQVAVCVTEFLHRAPAWSADPGRSDEELRDSARRMIYWVMKERWARSGKKEKKAQPDFLDWRDSDRSSLAYSRTRWRRLSFANFDQEPGGWTKRSSWTTSRTPNWR
jgi:hypothetical protein